MRLVVGNILSEEYGFHVDRLSADDRVSERGTAFQMLWAARPGDVVVLPDLPDDGLLRYITGLTGVDPGTLDVVVPPAAAGDADVLTRDRLLSRGSLSLLSDRLGGVPVTQLCAQVPDSMIAQLARELDISPALPGYPLLAQRGAVLVNSKAVFRAVSAGVGVPIAEGGVCAEQRSAADMAAAFLNDDRHVMVKKDLGAGGTGNVVLTTDPGLLPVGAGRALTVRSRDEVARTLAVHWSWLSDDGRRPVVVEEYLDGSTAVFAELSITDGGVELRACGEIVSEPTVTAQMMPPRHLGETEGFILTSSATRLCEPLFAMGYRGILGADAIVTPDGRVLFTEYNGRPTGSTLVYDDIGYGVVHNDWQEPRFLLERRHWHVDSFDQALRYLDSAGTAYDKEERKGVILTRGYDETRRMVRYCVVGESWEEVEKIDNAMP